MVHRVNRTSVRCWSTTHALRVLLICGLVFGIILYFVLFANVNNTRSFAEEFLGQFQAYPNNPHLQKRLQESELNWQKENEIRSEREKALKTVAELTALVHMDHMDAFWDFFKPSFKCPFNTLVLGQNGSDGSKTVCGLQEVVNAYENCVVYSFGINIMISFDQAILARTNCTLHMFEIDEKLPVPTRILDKYSQRATYTKLGIGARNEGTFRTLKTFMDLNEDTFIHILKMDIEGAEWESLERALLDFPNGLPVGQLLLELHPHNYKHRDWYILMRNLWFVLEQAGFRPFFREVNPFYPIYVEVGFININVRPFLLVRTNPFKPLVWNWDKMFRKNISEIEKL